MLATKTHTTMRGHRVCSEHHWADNKDTDCRGCVWEYERAARNIAFALAIVAVRFVATNAERARCLEWVQWCRENGECDMRVVRHCIESGDQAADEGE
jgi:hypothetical protein